MPKPFECTPIGVRNIHFKTKLDYHIADVLIRLRACVRRISNVYSRPIYYVLLIYCIVKTKRQVQYEGCKHNVSISALTDMFSYNV